MKIAISLPDDLSASAGALARRLGMSRSGLIAAALAEFVAKHRASKVTERLDTVYSAEESRIDKPTRRAQAKAVHASEW
jgi:metal-responsive CopG/Arc/MetJ family transcriptional regulator